MTIFEALGEYFGYGSENAMQLALDNVSLTGLDTYVFATHNSDVILASAYLMQMKYNSPNISEQDAKIDWEKTGLLKRMNQIFRDNDLSNECIYTNQITIKKNVFGD